LHLQYLRLAGIGRTVELGLSHFDCLIRTASSHAWPSCGAVEQSPVEQSPVEQIPSEESVVEYGRPAARD
jgi:hypothetical protein